MTQYFGKYRAIVNDVADPEKRGRLLVTVPSLNEDDVLGWAEACLPPGVFMLPKKGTAVYIEFEEGDINLPIWVGVLPTNKYVKDTFFSKESYDPARKIVLFDKKYMDIHDAEQTEKYLQKYAIDYGEHFNPYDGEREE